MKERLSHPTPARLCKISFVFAEAAGAKALAGALRELLFPPPAAVSLFEEPSGWRVEAYVETLPGPLELALVAEALAAAKAGPLPQAHAEEVPDANWAAVSQSALPPVCAGGFVIFGRHDRQRVALGPRAICIEAGEAFGTGHHATTSGCLMALERLQGLRNLKDRKGQHVLDLGTGTGVLAIACARAFPSARILAADMDPIAVRIARENVAANGVAARIRAVRSEGFSHPEVRRGRFDLIAANILAGPLMRLAPEFAQALKPGGRVLLSGILEREAWAVVAACRAAGLALSAHARLEGWSILTFRPGMKKRKRESRAGVIIRR